MLWNHLEDGGDSVPVRIPWAQPHIPAGSPWCCWLSFVWLWEEQTGLLSWGVSEDPPWEKRVRVEQLQVSQEPQGERTKAANAAAHPDPWEAVTQPRAQSGRLLTLECSITFTFERSRPCHH